MSLCYLLHCANLRQCFGEGANGMLGNGGTTSISSDQTGDAVPYVDLGADFYAIALSTGDGNIYHHCAVSVEASLLCWGSNDYGQLGVGDSVDKSSAVTPRMQIAITAAPTSAPSAAPTGPTRGMPSEEE